MTKLRTADQWWTEYEAIKTDIRGYIRDRPIQEILNMEMAARMLPMRLWDAYLEHKTMTVFQLWDIWDTEKEVEILYTFLQSIWVDAPDSPSIHSWPSWGRFCDLLSEGPRCLGLVE